MTIAITISPTHSVVVDDLDSDLAERKWTAFPPKHDGVFPYARTDMRIDGIWRGVSMHRLILQRKIGRALLKTEYADHIDCDRSNNRRDNLRVVSPTENAQNKSMRRTNTSGYVGVYKRQDKWCAQIYVEGKHIGLGCYETPEEAHSAYVAAALRYFGEYAHNSVKSQFAQQHPDPDPSILLPS